MGLLSLVPKVAALTHLVPNGGKMDLISLPAGASDKQHGSGCALAILLSAWGPGGGSRHHSLSLSGPRDWVGPDLQNEAGSR